MYNKHDSKHKKGQHEIVHSLLEIEG